MTEDSTGPGSGTPTGEATGTGADRHGHAQSGFGPANDPVRPPQAPSWTSRWRARYRPGNWIVLSGPTSLVFLQPAAPQWSALINTVWEAVLAAASIDELAASLAAFRLNEMPDLGALFWGTDGMRSLVRGRVLILDPRSGTPVASGDGIQTWTEIGLGSLQAVRIASDQPPADAERGGLELPLVVGAVQASEVLLDASEEVQLVSPQGAFVQGPETGEEQGFSRPVVPMQSKAGQLAEPPVAEPTPPQPPPSEAAPSEPAAPEAVSSEAVSSEPAAPESASSESAPSESASSEALSSEAASSEPAVPESASSESASSESVSSEAAPSGPAASQPVQPEPALDRSSDPAAPNSEPAPDPLAADADTGHTVIDSNLPGMPHQVPTRPPRSVLAVLHPSSGGAAEVDRPVLIGRAPEAKRVSGDQLPHLVTVPSPSQDISRTHVQISPEQGQLIVTDMHSTNGTILVQPGGSRTTLSPGQGVTVEYGSAIDLGDGLTIAIDRPEV